MKGFLTALGDKARAGFIGNFFRILWISGRRYSADEHGQRAVALTFYTLFAIVPVAALLFGIAKGFDLDEKLRMTLAERFSHHKDILEYIYHFANTTLKQAKGGIVAGVGVIALLCTVMGLAASIEKAFNAVWGLSPRRNILHRFSNYLSGLLLMPVMLVLISSAGVFLRSVFNRMISSGSSGVALVWVLALVSHLTPLLLAILIFFLIYLFAPNTRVRVLPALLAGAFAGICYQALQDSFIFLQGSIFRYNRIYGSFAVLPLFLMWMRWSWDIALFGAEVGFVAQNLHTGMFDRSEVEAHPSHHLRRFWQLAAAQKIYAKFASGAGSSSFEELSRGFALPTVRLERELNVLLDAGIICRAEVDNDAEAFVPLLPPDELTIGECLRRLDAAGDAEVNPAVRDSEPELYAALDKLQNAVLKCPENRRLTAL